MIPLAQKECIPCKGGTPPLSEKESSRLLTELGKGWQVIDNHHLEKEYHFKNFKDGLDFTVKVGNIAEEQGHHPDIFLTWGKVKITVYTHKIDGLSESDFIFAAKVEESL